MAGENQDVTPTFSFEGSSEPVQVEATVEQPIVTDTTKDANIEEKDKHIEEEKPEITKTNEPDKTPGATPKPIQERPDEVKENIIPATELKAEELIKFENAESKRLFELLQAGKTKEVYAVLAEQEKLENVKELKPEEVIKLNLQYQHKNLDASEIQDLFNESYQLPKEPVQKATELDEDFEERMTEYKDNLTRIQNKINRDAKVAIPELEKYKQNIVLPELPKQLQEEKEPTQEELEAQSKLYQGFSEAALAELNNFKGYQAAYKGEEAEFPVAYNLTEDQKKEIAPLIALSHTNAGEFLSKLGWLDKNGNINSSKLAEDLPLLVNKQQVFEKLVSDAGGEMRKALAKNIKNVDVSGNNASSVNSEKTNEEKQKDFATHFFTQASS